ncbi:MAG: hypothetical protein LCH93_28250 [Proteobacteria bacterium]|jgi:hypothetical protein|nr:hypothetical protein [Pseudomonadota bacterium]
MQFTDGSSGSEADLAFDIAGSALPLKLLHFSGVWGEDMPFQGVVVEPAELAKLARAFDAAWMAVNSVNTVGGQQQRRARARLAGIILDLWREDPAQALSASAVERFLASDQLN